MENDCMPDATLSTNFVEFKKLFVGEREVQTVTLANVGSV